MPFPCYFFFFSFLYFVVIFQVLYPSTSLVTWQHKEILCLIASHSLSVSVTMSVCLSVCLSVCVCVSACLPACLPLSLSLSPSLLLSLLSSSFLFLNFPRILSSSSLFIEINQVLYFTVIWGCLFFFFFSFSSSLSVSFSSENSGASPCCWYFCVGNRFCSHF